MHPYFFRIIATGVLLLSLSACGGSSDGEGDSSATEQPINEEWVGLYRATSGPETNEPGIIEPDVYEGGIFINMRKQGSEVTGSYKTTDGGEGSISGTFDSEEIDLTLTQNENCPGTIFVSGVPSKDGSNVTTTISGNDCERFYHSGTARLIKSPPPPTGTDFTGVYFGISQRSTGFLLSIATQDGYDFQGTAWVLTSDLGANPESRFTMISSPVSGTLGNADDQCTSSCYTRLEMTNAVSDFTDIDGEAVEPVSGHVTILDHYLMDSTKVLRTSWSLQLGDEVNLATGGVNMEDNVE